MGIKQSLNNKYIRSRKIISIWIWFLKMICNGLPCWSASQQDWWNRLRPISISVNWRKRWLLWRCWYAAAAGDHDQLIEDAHNETKDGGKQRKYAAAQACWTDKASWSARWVVRVLCSLCQAITTIKYLELSIRSYRLKDHDKARDHKKSTSIWNRTTGKTGMDLFLCLDLKNRLHHLERRLKYKS